MKFKLRIFFSLVILTMLFVTTWASLEADVFTGGGPLLQMRWGIATLADAYFGFLTFSLWVFYKERSMLSRIIWFVLIMVLGNMAMAAYALWQIQKSKTDSFEGVFLRET